MSISFTPQFFISYIPDGKINFTPQIYASVVFVPHVEKVVADTARNLSKTENATADTLRKIGNSENTRADLSRNVKNIERAVADTSRKIGVVTATADTCRLVKNLSTATADSLRKVGISEKVPADFLRKVAVFEKISADTFLKITATEKATADTCRRMIERATADTLRKIVRPEKVFADTIIRTPHILNFIAQDSLVNSFVDYQVSLFEVALNEHTLSDSFTLETARQININDAVKGSFLDYPFSFLVEEKDWQDLFISVKGMYDIDKLLYSFIESDMREETESYLDGVKYYGAASFINRIADYFGFSANIKIENFIPYNIFNNSNVTYADLIGSLFNWTERLPQRQINVFIRGNTLHCIQRGLEDSVFDISNIPHSRPHFNEKLIRSMYNNPFGDNDIEETTDDAPFSGVITYSDEFSTNSITYSNGLLIEEYSRTHNSKVDATSKSTYSYTQFTIEGETQYYLKSKRTENTSVQSEDANSITSSSLSLFKNASKTVESAETSYIYSFSHRRAVKNDEDGGLYYGLDTEVYLRKEYEINTKTEYIKGAETFTWTATDSEANERQTLHSPCGNGWYSTTVYENGEHKGSTISQGAPSNQVSQYTIQRIRQLFGSQSDDPEEQYEEERSKLAPIADISFPVRELDLIERLTDDLKWLNRKIQVTVTVDLISKIENGVPDLKHIVDFTERVKLDGYEYFLVSNNIRFTPRSLIQSLQLVRWTE